MTSIAKMEMVIGEEEEGRERTGKMDEPLLGDVEKPVMGSGSEAGGRSTGGAQLRAVLRKNWMQRMRGQPGGGRRWRCMTGTAGFLVEILLPVLFIILCCLPRWLGGGIVSFDAKLKRETAIDDASHASWRPANLNMIEQSPRIFISPLDESSTSVDTGRLVKLGHAASEAIACNFAAAVRRAGTAPPEAFSSWFFKDVARSTVIACAMDCTNAEDCVQPLMHETLRVFNSSYDAELAVASTNARLVSPFLVQLGRFDELGIDTTIRMNHTDTIITKQEERYFRFFGSPPTKYKEYFSFMNMQSILSRAGMGVLLAEKRRDDEVHPLDLDVHVQPFPWRSYTLDQGALAAGAIFSILIVFAFISPSKANTTCLVREKEQRQREGMLLMGLRLEMYWLSWFLTFLGMSAISSLGMAVVGRYPFSYSDVWVMFSFYLAISAATISMSFFFSTLFSSAKVAATMTTLLYVAAMIPSSLVQIIYPDGSALYWLVCLLPPSAVGLFTKALITLESGQSGLTWQTIHFDVLGNPSNPFRALDVLLMLAVDVVFFAVLTWYCDKVLPREFGQRLPLLFPFDVAYWFPELGRRRERRALELARSRNSSAANLTALEAEHAGAAKGGAQIDVRMLTKAFGGAIAVDDLCLSLRPGIVALLGANGAGKVRLFIFNIHPTPRRRSARPFVHSLSPMMCVHTHAYLHVQIRRREYKYIENLHTHYCTFTFTSDSVRASVSHPDVITITTDYDHLDAHGHVGADHR